MTPHMNITYLGHASFKLDFKSASVVTDPFDKSRVGLPFKKQKATIVTVSHDHFDHNKTENVSDVKREVSGPGEYDIEGISIIGIPSFHDDKNGEERGKNTIFIFEAEDLRIAHLGDLGHNLSEKQLSSIGDIDVLMIPVGGVYTIDDAKAAEVARAIEPDIIIPMHYKQPGMAESFKDLKTADPFINEMGVKLEKISGKFSVRKSDLVEEDLRIVVFEN